MAHHIGGDFVAAAENDGVVIAIIAYVGDAADEGLHDDGKRARLTRIVQLPQIGVGHQHDLRNGIVEALDFPVINRLHLPPELTDFLLRVVEGENLAETFQSQNFGRKFVAAQPGLKLGRRPGNDAEPDVARKHFAGVARLVVAIKLADRVHGGSLLRAKLRAELRAKRGPVVGADFAIESRGVQSAHGGEHGFVAVHGDVGGSRRRKLRPGTRAEEPARTLRRSTEPGRAGFCQFSLNDYGSLGIAAWDSVPRCGWVWPAHESWMAVSSVDTDIHESR